MRRYQSNPRKHRGISTVWFAVIMIVLVGILGLMVDAARVYLTTNQLQNAADAAALAGARYVAVLDNPEFVGTPEYRDAIMEAIKFAKANDTLREPNEPPGVKLNQANGDILIGRFITNPTYPHGQFFTEAQWTAAFPTVEFMPDALKVFARKDGTSNPRLALLFGSIFKVASSHIERFATAKIYDPYGAGMIALAKDGIGLEFSGGGNNTPITILNGGSIHINSSSSNAIDGIKSHQSIDADSVYIVGSASDGYVPNSSTDVHENLGADGVVPDPYAGVFDKLPAYDPTNPKTISTSSVNEEGYYPNGIKVNGDVVLKEGIYYLGGPGLQMNNGSLKGEKPGDNILLVIVKGSVTLKNEVRITGHSDYEDIAIYQTTNNDSTIKGTNGPTNIDSGINGVIYMPNNRLILDGNGGAVGTRLVAARYKFNSGASTIRVDFKGQPRIANKSYLVE